MKANRRFLSRIAEDEEAVSPVIAVILMVAITVVLAATVYVWVSGFSDDSSGPTTDNLVLQQDGSISDCSSNKCKAYTVATATPGLEYGDVKFTIDGKEYTIESSCSDPSANEKFTACAGATTRASSDTVEAGDKLVFRDSALKDKTLRLVHTDSNTVINSYVIRS